MHRMYVRTHIMYVRVSVLQSECHGARQSLTNTYYQATRFMCVGFPCKLRKLLFAKIDHATPFLFAPSCCSAMFKQSSLFNNITTSSITCFNFVFFSLF